MGLASLTLEFIAGPEIGRKVCIAEFRPILLGRAGDADVVLPAVDTSVSRHQAYIQLSPDACVLRIVPGSNSVVTCNDVRVDEQCLLAEGDILCFGTTGAKTVAKISIAAADFECLMCGITVDPVNQIGSEHLAQVNVYAHEDCMVTRDGDAASAFGPYEICGEVIGAGGAGSVYRVYHRPSRTVWALKHRTNPGQARRFDREMFEMQELNHPNIIRFVHGNVDAGGVPYYVMEYAREGNLTLLANKLEDSEKIRLICEVLEGLEYLHQKGKVHRDLKPDNILIQIGGRAPSRRQAKVSDLGLIRGGGSIVLTAKGHSFCGTIPFIAPEQIDGLHDADKRADIYSAGVTLYWLLSQRTPIEFSDAQLSRTREEIRSGYRTPLKRWRPDLPSVLLKTIDRACNREPHKRFPTANHFQDALRKSL
jgi:hypothetical protein